MHERVDMHVLVWLAAVTGILRRFLCVGDQLLNLRAT